MLEKLKKHEQALAVVGLGYVGLPLAVAFARYFRVIGFDVNQARVDALKSGHDATLEVSAAELNELAIDFTTNPADLKKAGLVIVAVPTPIDKHCQPDLSMLLAASRLVGENLAKGAVVVYESTVYPGVTEDICVPVLSQASGLELGRGFTVGYSPERINPGDKVHTLETIVKVVAGSDQATLEFLARVYGTVVKAGIHCAQSIKVAEAAKVIENTQRDINIALMNELALIFEKMDIDTLSVLQAAGTKWNFLPFRPGLVGGHCIGVDPYYLTHKAEELGYHPQIILSGRRLNDNMGKYVAEACVKSLIKLNHHIAGARVGILGFTFKENVPDIRNTRVIDIINELKEYGIKTLVHDPLADPAETMREYSLDLVKLNELRNLDALMLCVAHEQYSGFELRPSIFRDPLNGLIMDVKGFWEVEKLRQLGFHIWRL